MTASGLARMQMRSGLALAIRPRVSAAVWRAAGPGRGTSAPVERIEQRGLSSPSLGFRHAEYREPVGERLARPAPS
jgi:hypothetical protein